MISAPSVAGDKNDDVDTRPVSVTQFLSEDIRYTKGGIYEHGDDAVVPAKKIRARFNLPFTPRVVTLKQPKLQGPNKRKEAVGNNSSGRRKYDSRGKADPKYTLKSPSHLDNVLAGLDPLPKLPFDAPKFLAREDIRNAQDIDDVASLWRGERSARAVDRHSVWTGKWVLHQLFPIKEGQELAIHSHRTLAADEYPVLPMYEMGREEALVMAPKIRLPASMDINAFLNSKSGQGRLLLGISDDRAVKGLYLTSDQRRHVEENLDDLLCRRYSPPVPKDAFRVEFHPVANGCSEEIWSSGPVKECVDTASARGHVFRSASLCWCDRQALVGVKRGYLPNRYVIDIRVDGRCRGSVEGRMPTFFADEVGCVCVRRGPENAIPSVEEILDDAIENIERLAL